MRNSKCLRLVCGVGKGNFVVQIAERKFKGNGVELKNCRFAVLLRKNPLTRGGFEILLDVHGRLVNQHVLLKTGNRAVGLEFLASVIGLGRTGEEFGDRHWVDQGIFSSVLKLQGSRDNHPIGISVNLALGNPQPLGSSENEIGLALQRKVERSGEVANDQVLIRRAADPWDNGSIQYSCCSWASVSSAKYSSGV